jgi:hypothetical protein
MQHLHCNIALNQFIRTSEILSCSLFAAASFICSKDNPLFAALFFADLLENQAWKSYF